MGALTIGAKFRRMREFLGLSRPQLGEMIGIPSGSIKSIESDQQEHGPSYKVLGRIANHPELGKYVLWLITDSLAHLGYDDPADPLEPVDITNRSTAAVDKELLITIVEAVEESLAKGNKNLPPSKKGELIYILYTQAIKNYSKNPAEEPIDRANISMLVDYAC